MCIVQIKPSLLKLLPCHLQTQGLDRKLVNLLQELLPSTTILKSDFVTRQLTNPDPSCIANADAVLNVSGPSTTHLLLYCQPWLFMTRSNVALLAGLGPFGGLA